MRPASVSLQASIASESTTLARLWRVTRTDGTVVRFTDAVRPITITIAPDVTPQVYRADISFTSSAIFTSSSAANLQSVTVTFITDDAGISEKNLRARLYDSAAAEVFVVDYENPSFGVVAMYDGIFGVVTLSDQHVATVSVTPSQSTVSGAAIGTEKYSQTCRASLGDARCKVNLTPLKVAFTVISASGGSFVAAAIGQENAHWALGFVKWLTGVNAGRQSSVQSNDSGTTSVFLLSPPFFPIAAGDTGEIYPGCDKLRQTCLNKFNNVVNGRFEPDVPDGSDVYTNFTAISGGG